ncbi:MAG: hypothetical protein ABFS12_03130 [Bacteroidota bacterium]
MNIASIDIGSNTVLLLISEIDTNKKVLNPLLNIYRMPRISKGMNNSKIIDQISIDKLLDVLKEYKSLIIEYECSHVIVNATQALRTANNSKTILSKIKSELSFDINIISGEREAYLSFLGVLSGFQRGDSTIVIDIGGASTEIIAGQSNEILFSKSYPIGVVTLTEKFSKSPLTSKQLEEMKNYIATIFNDLPSLNSENSNVIAVAGTPTTLACAKQSLSAYNENKVEGFKLYQDNLKEFITQFQSMTPMNIKNEYGVIMSGREDIILAGTLILSITLEIINKDYLYSSGRGLRYGAIIDYMQSINKG